MKMDNDDINDYLPSILNPRGIKKRFDLTLTQNSVTSCRSLSLKRANSVAVKRNLHKAFWCDKENSQTSPKLGRHTVSSPVDKNNKENVRKSQGLAFLEGINKNVPVITQPFDKNHLSIENADEILVDDRSIGLSAIDELETVKLQSSGHNAESNPFSFKDLNVIISKERQVHEKAQSVEIENLNTDKNVIVESPIKSVSSVTEINEVLSNSEGTIVYDLDKPLLTICFGVNDCSSINIKTKNSNIKNISLSRKDNNTNVECEVIESSVISIASESDDENAEAIFSAPSNLRTPNSTFAVNLEIKRKKQVNNAIENDNVLILNTNDITKLSHVIVQPPNYKLVKRKILNTNKLKNIDKRKLSESAAENGKIVISDRLKQKRIDAYFSKTFVEQSANKVLVSNDDQDMSKTFGVGDPVNCEHVGRAAHISARKQDQSPVPNRLRSKTDTGSPRPSNNKVSGADARRVPSKGRNDSLSSQSPRKNVDSVQFSVSAKSKSLRNPSPRNVPHYKIVAGTHFAVDAFSYGEIPNVKHYFLTHFHSDHYSGLKKTFSKFLFCSKITADLCISRLGVSPKCIRVINFDETLTVDGIEVTAVDANHCPGAIMLVFTLANGKTLLHTGDFRASPLMESYPVFWNKDINTIYLDTTYCNPRYDFPTQDQSLEMALYILRQKKLALEKIGKKFASVLIVCGTYTIGKEKFFLGMARRVGCSVWACPEKDRVLQAVEGRSFSHAPAHSCQLHVVPMRDLSHEKLRSYLDSLHGAFDEVVAFKPSGWENGKNSTTENDCITIHGIPYSEHSSFSELVRFVKFLKPKQVVPTVDITGGAKTVQKYFPCPLVCKEEVLSQSKVSDYFSIQNRQQVPAVT